MQMYGHSTQNGGASRKGRRAVPNAPLMAGLFLAVLFGNREVARPVQAFSDDIPCPTEALFCLADGECSDCVDALRTLSAETLSDFETCSELNGRVCQILETEPGCDTTNSNLVEFARCVAEEMFGCNELAECSEFPDMTPAPMASMTDAMMGTGTPVSTVSIAPTSAPVMARDLPTAMPTSAPSAMDPTGSPTPSPSMVGRGIDLMTEAPTATPTAAPTISAGDRGIDIATSAPAGETDEAEATSGSSTSFTTSSTLISSLVAIGVIATAWMA